MPQGYQVWDQYGRIVTDTSTRMGRFIGYFYMNNQTVVINSPAVDQGIPFQIVTISTIGANAAPTMTVAPGQLTFTPSNSPGGSVGYVFYGVF